MKLTNFNSNFEKSLIKIKKLKQKNYNVDLKEILKFLKIDFIEFQGCVTYDYGAKPVNNVWKKYNNKKTQFELFENHIHMSDFIPNQKGLILLNFGLAIVEVLSLKLKAKFPKYSFRIIN